MAEKDRFASRFRKNCITVAVSMPNPNPARELPALGKQSDLKNITHPCDYPQRPPSALTSSTLASSRRRAMSMAVRSLVNAALCAVTTSRYPTAPP
jgi:hypothetical protein